MNVDSVPAIKRQRFTAIDPMELETAKAKLAAAKEKFGREIRVFETATASSAPPDVSSNVSEEPEDFYEFTPEDYYRLLGTKKEDNYILEATFHPSETIQSLLDLLVKVIAHPELPFYIYTTPPKKQIKDVSVDFYSAGFVPGAVVYFSYDVPKEEVMSLQGLDSMIEKGEPAEPSKDESPTPNPPASVPDQKPTADKKKIKPKWLKL
ncbi:unnamed protein product [Withania somnifera]